MNQVKGRKIKWCLCLITLFTSLLRFNISAQIELTPYVGFYGSHSSGGEAFIIQYEDAWLPFNYLIGAKINVGLNDRYSMTLDAGYSHVQRALADYEEYVHLQFPMEDISYDLFLISLGLSFKIAPSIDVDVGVQADYVHEYMFHYYNDGGLPTGEENSSLLLGPNIGVQYQFQKISIFAQISYTQKEFEIPDFANRIFRARLGVRYSFSFGRR